MPFDKVSDPKGRDVLAIQGSPRDGNTRTALEWVVQGLREPTRVIELDEECVLPIGDCAHCLDRGECTQVDSFAEVYRALLGAPLWIMATPLYWYGPSAPLKALMDRWSCGYSTDKERFPSEVRGKGMALVIAQADPNLDVSNPFIESVRMTCDYMGMRLAGVLQIVAKGRNDVRESDTARHDALSFGEQLRASL